MSSSSSSNKRITSKGRASSSSHDDGTSSSSSSNQDGMIIRVGQFNLLNLHSPNKPFHFQKKGYTQKQVDAKVNWISSQLIKMNCGIVGFEEVFDVEPLKQACEMAGYPTDITNIITTNLDGQQPGLALLSIYKIVSWEVITDFPNESILHMPDLDIFSTNNNNNNINNSTRKPVEIPINRFNKPIIKATIDLPTGHLATIFVVHLKSQRPLVKTAQRFDNKAKALGHALSLLIRGSEAAALRCLLVDQLVGKEDSDNYNDDSGSDSDSLSMNRLSISSPSSSPRRGKRTTASSSRNKNQLDINSNDDKVEDGTRSRRRQRKHSKNNSTSSISSRSRSRSSNRLSKDGTSSSCSKRRTSRNKRSTSLLLSSSRKNTSTTEERTIIVIGDLNEGLDSVSTRIITGTPPWKNLPQKEKEEIWKCLLYSCSEIQVRPNTQSGGSEKNIYSHIHNGKYDALDHILVSNNLARSNPSHIGYILYTQFLNDHLVDQTLVDKGDLVYGGPLVDKFDYDDDDDYDDYDDYDQLQQKLQGDFKKFVDIRSDHGQVVATIKIWPTWTRPPKPTREI